MSFEPSRLLTGLGVWNVEIDDEDGGLPVVVLVVVVERMVDTLSRRVSSVGGLGVDCNGTTVVVGGDGLGVVVVVVVEVVVELWTLEIFDGLDELPGSGVTVELLW